MSPQNCRNGVDSVEVLQIYFPGTKPPPTTASAQHLQQTASQDAITPATAPATAPPPADPFPADASLAITTYLGVEPDIIKVVPTLLTPPPLKDVDSYTSDPSEILRFEVGQLVFRTRTALALAQSMATRTPSANQAEFKNDLSAVNESINNALKLINNLSISINGDFWLPPASIPSTTTNVQPSSSVPPHAQ